jgi:hypothetical protein
MHIEGGLTPEATERPRARRYTLPIEALDRNPSWRETLNSLRSPRRRRETFGEWHRRCPIRPIVFEDPGLSQLGAPTDGAAGPEPVHMHLEHRVSQRLLGRFLAQGYAEDDLARACLTQSEGSLPLVYLIGRLCLYGEHAARLHEDLVAVCAEWVRPDARAGRLRPVEPGRLSEEEVLRRLDEALLASQTHLIPEGRRNELLASAGRDVAELLVHLKAKRQAVEDAVRKDLYRAAEEEAEKTRVLLERQKTRIEADLRKHEVEDERLAARAAERRARDRASPALFDLGEAEDAAEDDRIRRERAAERRAMVKRLEELPGEIEREPGRIRTRHEVKSTRFEPVGLVYLWPERG